MIKLRLNEIAEVLGADVVEQNLVIDSIETDSRKVRYGSLFAALKGTRVDGHEFAASAINNGAVALLAERTLDLPVPQLVVDDVLQALGLIAGHIREQVIPQVIGITGSNGKTTVKEMLTSILRRQGTVLSTQGNFNNELGLPLTLFQLKQKDQFAVLEMGASKAGDIAYLAGIARPIVGVITNIGPAHLEGFGSLQGVAAAKGEMYQSLPAEGCAIINGDEPFCDFWQKRNRANRMVRFGTSEANEITYCLPGHEADPDITVINTPAGAIEVKLSLPGAHNRANAAAATAAAFALGIPLEDIAAGLEAVTPVPGRLNLIKSARGGWTVIDDTYNANPASLYSALQVLSSLQGTAWLVLGDMKELGEDSHKLHAEVGDAARALGVKRIFAMGEMSALTVDAFGSGADHFSDQASLIAALKSALRPGINCLVKGSRSMGMENVVKAIAESSPIREAC